jgi:hypothetical protein
MQNPTDQAVAPIPPEIVSNDLIPTDTTVTDFWKRIVHVHRTVARRTEPLYIPPPLPPTPQQRRRGARKRHPHEYFALPPTPQAEDIPARKKPRLEDPFSYQQMKLLERLIHLTFRKGIHFLPMMISAKTVPRQAYHRLPNGQYEVFVEDVSGRKKRHFFWASRTDSAVIIDTLIIIESYFKSCRSNPLWEKSDPDRRQV